MLKEFSRAKIAKELTEILNGLLSTGDWQSSLFLKAASKRIQVLLEEAKSVVELTDSEESKSSQILPQNYVPIYISLYQINGNDLQSWQYTLRLLVEHNVSRPTYSEEQYVRGLIGSKTDIERHGYAVIYVKKDEIYHLDEQVKDSLGHELLTLKEGAIKLRNIVGFVHANKERYSFVDGVLVSEN